MFKFTSPLTNNNQEDSVASQGSTGSTDTTATNDPKATTIGARSYSTAQDKDSILGDATNAKKDAKSSAESISSKSGVGSKSKENNNSGKDSANKSKEFPALTWYHKLANLAVQSLELIITPALQEKLRTRYAHEDVTIHWRPNYELMQVKLWLCLAWGYLILGVSLSIGGLFFAVLANSGLSKSCLLLWLMSMLLALISYPQALQNRYWLDLRYQRKLLIFNSQTLQSQLVPQKWWLGKGFYWDSKHTFRQQAIQQQFKMAQHPAYSQTTTKMGSSWLHTLDNGEQNIYLDCEHTNGHMLIVGTTGSGKTRAFDLLIQQAIMRQESVIIIDPKGDHDLREKALATAHKLGMADRFLAFSPAFAQQSIALDLLGNYAKTSDLAQRIISLMPNSANAGPFRAVSYKAVLTIIEALQALHKKITLLRIYLCVTIGLKDLLVELLIDVCQRHQLDDILQVVSNPAMDTRAFNVVLRTYVKDYHPQIQEEALLNLIELYKHDSTHLTKMLATLLPGLQVLATPPMNELITPELEQAHNRVLFNLQSLTTTNYILYVGLDSLSDATLSGNIGSLLLSDLAALAGTIYNYKDIKKPLNIFVDEAGEVVNDAFIQILNKGRGAGLRCFTATQTIADFNVRTGDREKTRQMLGNFNNWLALRTTDFETQKYLAESLRRTRIQVKQGNYANKDAFTNNSFSESLNVENTPLVTPDILAELPNFEYIARVAGGQIIKGRLPIVSLDE
ncbi:conjugative transfer system coupling protein TraD [Psittacicella hinzii]|uniref:Uncharacterized protein n=1 Tax=Psittacicella hinzii TaxID=2028575 RepID=A0A3A1YKC8_9GAMM|nr:conjugative transfer system coupling protein TraD [Psittacicella hinzii]RIY38632.1 hypothetical protein CKF58_03770 [Psittacicella hinzii]